jgi:hypothetical protein
MARNSLKKGRDSIKEKTKHVAVLIDEFLEREITEASLKEHPEEIYKIRDLLEKHLWMGNIGPHDPDWQFESDQCLMDVPELDADAIHQDEIDMGAKIISSFHEFLKKGFWEKFKAGVLAYNDRYGDDPLLSESFIKAELGQYVQIHISFGDGIHFFSSSLEAIRLLMDLIQGLKPEQFKKCADKDCGKFIFLTTKHKKDYCSVNCAARCGERKKREADRAAFNKYHQEYYKNKRKGGEKTVKK